MANWEKLNKEFHNIIDNLTDQELSEWYNNRLNNKELRKQSYQLSEIIYALRNDFRNILGAEILNDTIISNCDQNKPVHNKRDSIKSPKENYFPLAA